MKEGIRIISVLTLVCVLCAFLISFVNGIAQEKIENNNRKKIKDSILILVPQAARIENIKADSETVYQLFDDNNMLLGYAFLAKGDGYQGPITILAVIDTSLGILEGIEIIDSVETPGLGAMIKEEPFKSQFKKLNVSGLIECIKTDKTQDNQIGAITSATVSSKSVVNILNKKIEDIKRILKNPAQ
jgi:electron transport complex protein RnfG